MESPWISVFMIQVRLLCTLPRTFQLMQIKQNLVGYFFVLLLGIQAYLDNHTGPCESDYSYCYFDSDAHYDNSAHLAFVCWAFSFDSCHWDPITLIAFRFPSWVSNSPYCRFGLQRPTKLLLLLEEFKDARAPHTNLFLSVVVKVMVSWTFLVWWLSLKWHYWF